MKCVGPTLSTEEIAAIRRSLSFAPDLEEAAELFNLASNPTRLKIIFLLDRLAELCVCDLAEMLDVSVSAVSQHLAKLRAYGLVTSRRDAQTIFYRLTEHSFNADLRSVILGKGALEIESVATAVQTPEAGHELVGQRRLGLERRP